MVKRRVLAYIIDNLIVICYVILLFLITIIIHRINDITLQPQDPVVGNVISFFTLTLPVFLYFYLNESSDKKGTIGKLNQKIVVENNIRRNIFIRVLFKILPWEIAHIGIHWLVYYTNNNMEIPTWNSILIVLPNIILLVYFLSMVGAKGKSSIYDKIANTSINFA